MSRPIAEVAKLAAVVAAIAAITTAACVGVNRLDPPPDDGAKSVIVVFTDAKETVVYASDVTGSLAASLPPFGGSADARDLVVVEFACPLERLGLAAGVQVLDDSRATYLPSPLGAYERAGPEPWRVTSIDPIAAVLAKLVPERFIDCPTATLVEIPGKVEYGVGLADGSALIAASEGVFFRAQPGELAARVGALSGRFIVMHRSGEELFAMNRHGEIWRATLSSPFAQYSTERFEQARDRLWLDGSNDASPFELYRVDPLDGVFARTTSTTWTGIDTVPPRTPQLAYGGVEWIAPGKAVAVGAFRLKYAVRGMTTISFENPREEPDLSAVATIKGVGTIVGGAGGLFYRLDEGELVKIGDTGLGTAILAIVPLGSGFVLVTEGRTLYWNGALRDCLEDPLPAIGAVKRMSTSSTAAVLTDSTVTFLAAPELEALERECSQ